MYLHVKFKKKNTKQLSKNWVLPTSVLPKFEKNKKKKQYFFFFKFEFWVEVDLFEDCEAKEISERAQRIYEKYFTQNERQRRLIFFSALSHSSLHVIERVFQSNDIPPEIFEQAKSEVFEQLETKDYP